MARPRPGRHARPWAWHPRVWARGGAETRRRECLRASASPRKHFPGQLVDARAKPWHDGGEVVRAGDGRFVRRKDWACCSKVTARPSADMGPVSMMSATVTRKSPAEHASHALLLA